MTKLLTFHLAAGIVDGDAPNACSAVKQDQCNQVPSPGLDQAHVTRQMLPAQRPVVYNENCSLKTTLN
jgi:hypothetical protein